MCVSKQGSVRGTTRYNKGSNRSRQQQRLNWFPGRTPTVIFPWFNKLRSHSGAVCCSGSDGEVITDADWESYQGRYRVRIDGRWIVVEPWAVVDTPHIDGRTVVWPYRKDGIVIIRCFMPRTMI